MIKSLLSPSRVPAALYLLVGLAALPVVGQSATSVTVVATPTAGTGSLLLTDRLIIKYRNGSPAANRPTLLTMGNAHAVVNREGPQMTRRRSNTFGAHVMQLDRPVSVAAARRMARNIAAADADVEYAEPDLVLRQQLVPNDTSWLSQWNYHEATAGINLPAAWDTTTGSGVVVAVLDTGYRPHADLVGNIVGGYDMVNTAESGNDGNGRDASALDPGDGTVPNECEPGSSGTSSTWHGTHVAGTIGAVSNNSSGVAGVAFGAKVLPVRVLGKCGGYSSDIADGMVWAAGGTVSGLPANAYPARVINLSLGGSGTCSTTLQNGINSARSRGAVVVVAAGNSGGDASGFTPGNCSGVVAVAAVGRSAARAYYSNFGSTVDIAAPGGDMRAGTTSGILSTMNSGSSAPGTDTYSYVMGTSMATPHVAGVAALVLAVRPTLTPDQVEALLKSSARAFPVACSGCGAGIVDAAAAVAAAKALGVSTPAATPTAVAEVEPNNKLAIAQVVKGALLTVNGGLSSLTDTDYYRVTIAAGATLQATLVSASSTGNVDLVAYNSAGVLLASSIKGLGLTDVLKISNTGSTAMDVGLRVLGGGRTTATSFKYTLGLSQ